MFFSWRKQSQSGQRERKQKYGEEVPKEVPAVPSKDGQPDLSGSATASPPQTDDFRHTTPGPPMQPPPKEGRLPPTPKDMNIFGGGSVEKHAPRLPPTVGSAFLNFPCSLAKNQFANRQFAREWLQG